MMCPGSIELLGASQSSRVLQDIVSITKCQTRKKCSRMILYLVRHGETDYNKTGKIQGDLPTSLNKVGREQIRASAEKLSSKEVSAIIHSPLKRTTQSAEIFKEKFGCDCWSDSRLAERGFGKLKGADDKEYTSKLDLYWDEKKNYSDDNSVEPILDFKRRAQEFLDDLKSKEDNEKSFIIISHGSTLAMIANILGNDIVELDIRNGDIIEMRL